MLIFLNLEYYYNAVEYRHKYFNTQHITIRKNICFIVCTTASPEEPPSVMSGLRVSVQQAKPASLIRLLCEQLPKVYVFSSHKAFTTFCAPFLNRISHFKILYGLGLCAQHIADTNPREPCISRSVERENTFLLCSYSEAK